MYLPNRPENAPARKYLLKFSEPSTTYFYPGGGVHAWHWMLELGRHRHLYRAIEKASEGAQR